MTSSVFASPPDRVEMHDVRVMQMATVEDLPSIQVIWPSFEQIVGLRGRKMYALIDTRLDTYTVCTPIRTDDQPDRLGLGFGTLPGGCYLRGRGEAPEVYGQIAGGMAELEASTPRDQSRPLVEF